MPKILFWNVAGAKTNKLEELSPSLHGYCGANKPDCVVVCEVNSLSKQSKGWVSFGNYVYVKPQRPQQTNPKALKYYHSKNDKRLYVFSPNPGVKATQITTGESRPLIHLTVSNQNFFVMHAQSVSSTSGPQATQMKAAYDEAKKLLANNQIAGMPVAIFGDLNIDLQAPTRLQSLAKHMKGHELDAWVQVGTGKGTHYNGKTNTWSELDWALGDPTFKCTVTAALRAPEKSPKNPKDEDMDWEGEGLPITAHSDHLALVLEW